MNSADLIRLLGSGDLCPYGETRMDQVIRSLRSADLIPVTGRGNSAAELTAAHAAHALIGANAPTAPGAAKFTKVWGKLSPSSVPTNMALSECRTLFEMLRKTLEDPNARLGVKSVSINLDWPAAEIEMYTGEVIEFGDPERSRNAGYVVTPTRRTVEYRAVVLRRIAIYLAGKTEIGSTGKIGRG
jgi:hypothetical protein